MKVTISYDIDISPAVYALLDKLSTKGYAEYRDNRYNTYADFVAENN